ncbi:MAG TPA: tetratricopeptide repeat protein [Ktedonobacterales bacterium]
MTYSEERARSKKKLEDEAVLLARESRWEEAAAKNRELLSFFTRDVSALNRLGKALSELGQYGEAKKAYTEALELDPDNGIARKNLDRLAQLREETTGARTVERADPRLFIEEPGKTGFTDLVDLAASEILAKLSAGDQVYLKPDGNLLYVLNSAGERIGRIEPRLASRLLQFMQGGNQYAAGIAEMRDHTVRLIIKEMFQDPKMFGRVSFPTQQGAGDTVRAYIKDTMLRYDHEEEEFGEEGEYLDDADDETDEDEGEELEESDSFRVEE